MGAFAAGVDQRIVTYSSDDTGGEADLEAFVESVAAQIGTAAGQGWRALSTSVLPARQVRGGMLDTGSTRTSLYAAVVLYAKD
jgi:hypothetical protein